MKKIIFLTVGLGWYAGTYDAKAFNMVNGGFENGNLSGWTVSLSSGASATATTSWNSLGAGGIPNGGIHYDAPQGSYFALLGSGAGNVYTTMYQDVQLDAGTRLVGWAAFDTTDFWPVNDSAYVKIQYDLNTTTLFSKDVAAVGDFGETPWMRWTFTAPVTGTYRLEAGVISEFDGENPSYLLVDVLPVPEPASVYTCLFALGLGGFWVLRRRQGRNRR